MNTVERATPTLPANGVKVSDRLKRIELIGKHVGVQAFSERREIAVNGKVAVKYEDMTTMEQCRLLLHALREAEENQE